MNKYKNEKTDIKVDGNTIRFVKKKRQENCMIYYRELEC